MKKIFSVLLSFVLFISCSHTIRLQAAGDLTFTAGSNIAAQKGATVTVPVTVSNNQGFAAVGMSVTYNADVLEIVSITDPITDMLLNNQFQLTKTPGTQWIHFVNTSLADWSGNGTLANITFKVKPAAPDGVSAINLAFTQVPDGKPGKANGDIISGAKTVSGSVNVSGTAASGPVFTAASYVQAIKGQQVTVPISVSGNPGFTAVGLEVKYDANALEIVNVSAPVSAMSLNEQFALTKTPGTQWVHLISKSLTDWNGSGTVINLFFKVKPTASNGPKAIQIAFTGMPDGTPANIGGDILRSAALVSGSVMVTDDAGNSNSSGSTVGGGSGSGGGSSGGGGSGGGEGSSGGGGGSSSGSPSAPSNTNTSSPFGFNNGNDAFTLGANTPLVLTIQKDFYLFSGVSANGVTLASGTDYTAKSGSTVISLQPGYLNTLSPGRHTVNVNFIDGETVRASFSVAQSSIGNNIEPIGSVAASGGGFIGNSYALDGVGSGAGGVSSGTGEAVSFGRIPQTGVLPNLVGLGAAAILSIVVIILIYKRKKILRE